MDTFRPLDSDHQKYVDSLSAREREEYEKARKSGELAGRLGSLHEINKDLTRQKIEAEWRESHDPKTKLLTYPAFTQRVKTILAEANSKDIGHEQRKNTDRFSLIIADLDDFKLRNTELGYQGADDICLIPTAEIVRSVTESVHRADDAITETSRFGGEEFLIFLGGTDLEGATEVAKTIKQHVNEITFGSSDKTNSLGISMGVVSFGPETTLEDAFTQANNALLYVKERPGKNQIMAVHFGAQLPVDSSAHTS